ncbi:hypothetical protein ACYZTX_28905 [Pseudomonas sp. MDT1-17]
MADFWDRFVKHYVNTMYADGKGMQLNTIASAWNIQFKAFINSQLVPAGLLSSGYCGLPVLPKKLYRNSSTRVSRASDETLVHTKLIHDIPLEITDEAAIYCIFDKLNSSMAALQQWAHCEIADLEARYKRRKFAAPNGKIRWINDIGTNQYGREKSIWMRNRQNPEHYANSSANLENHSYQYVMDKCKQIFPTPLDLTAHDLGLATTGSLYPHCVLLTILHPKITPGFLYELEIFDENGKQIGFNKTDHGHQLVGYKFRAGRREAEQVIELTENGAYIVQQIINITAYGREHLRLTGNDSYRYLFLSAVRSFGQFQRPKLASCTTSPKMLEKIVQGLKKYAHLSHEEAITLAPRANLSTVRATAGVLVYLKTKSTQDMSKALGHKKYDPQLLSRYLPAVIWDFFQERWIRIFQAGIILEAMQDRPNKIHASGFNSLDQVEKFLFNHAIKLPPEPLDNVDTTVGSESSILIGLNEGIFTELLKIKNNQYPSASETKSNLWIVLSSKIIDHVELNLADRPDIQSALRNAKTIMESTY